MAVRIQLDADDVGYARRIIEDKRRKNPKGYRYDEYAHNSSSFSAEDFETTTSLSIALESYLRRTFGFQRRAEENYRPDLPNGVEVAMRSTKHHDDGPYLCSRRGVHHPTVTGFAVLQDTDVVDVGFLVLPSMMPRIRIVGSYPKPSGVTRHILDRADAVAAGAELSNLDPVALAMGVRPVEVPVKVAAQRREDIKLEDCF